MLPGKETALRVECVHGGSFAADPIWRGGIKAALDTQGK
jgi:DMSO/TMAO reductase YedYZ molybdopterin-dependent catalytic subunit